MGLPPVRLDRAGEHPLAVQLADALRAAATGGTLRAGDRLPSTRELAVSLGVSRTVTAAAYDQLLAEGWVEGRRGAGTFVVDAPGAQPAVRPRSIHQEDPLAPLVDLRAGSPCVEVLDRAAWRRAWRAAAEPPPDTRTEQVGTAEFREAVVEHLLRHRGLPADPADVLATAGSTSAVAELARTLPPGSRVAVEEPGYQRAGTALREAGLVVVGVPVDTAGLVVAALPPGISAVYCTPAHQYPLGTRLSAARRVALVDRARTDGFLVIEDDYDGELRYDVAPLPLLAALGPDVVVHLGSASKLLTPTLGVGWLVAPPVVRDAVVDLRLRTGARPARAGQRVFTAFAAHGDLARHLRRLNRELADRRAEVAAAMAEAGAAVRGDAAGAHVVVPLPDACTERRVVDTAAARGVALDGLVRQHTGEPTAFGIVLGYAGPARTDLPGALAVVAELLASGPAGGPTRADVRLRLGHTAPVGEEQFQPDDVGAWRAWLAEHHSRGSGVWLVTWRARSGRATFGYEEAVEQALCFGWVDSKGRALDADRTMLWFAPRRPGSGWARTNKQRVERLLAAGLMAPAGLASVEVAKADGSWSKLDAVEDLLVPDDLAAAFAAMPPAAEHWEAFPRSARRAILEWITLAKRPETRARRVAETAEKAAVGERANQPRHP